MNQSRRKAGLPSRGGVSLRIFPKGAGAALRAFRTRGGVLSELSIFVDESGGQGGHSKYYGITLVFHDPSCGIEERLERHRLGLKDRGLADVPLHTGPLMTGHDAYENMDIKMRKAYLSLFFLDLQHLPVTYRTFLYRRSELGDSGSLVARMRRDIVNLIFDHLEYFQSFDLVKVYYDDGQEIVARAVHAAVEYALATDSLMYRKTRASDFMLAQAADLLCTIELTALKFKNGEATRTDEKFFGTERNFRRNYLKPAHRKMLGRGD